MFQSTTIKKTGRCRLGERMVRRPPGWYSPAKLRKMRVASGLSQADVAVQLGIGRATIERLELDRFGPSAATLAALAPFLNRPLPKNDRAQSRRNAYRLRRRGSGQSGRQTS